MVDGGDGNSYIESLEIYRFITSDTGTPIPFGVSQVTFTRNRAKYIERCIKAFVWELQLLGLFVIYDAICGTQSHCKQRMETTRFLQQMRVNRRMPF